MSTRSSVKQFSGSQLLKLLQPEQLNVDRSSSTVLTPPPILSATRRGLGEAQQQQRLTQICKKDVPLKIMQLPNCCIVCGETSVVCSPARLGTPRTDRKAWYRSSSAKVLLYHTTTLLLVGRTGESGPSGLCETAETRMMLR